MSVNIGTVACMDAGFTQKETAVKVLEEAAEAFAAWQECRDYEDGGGDLSKDGYPLSDLISECADVVQAVCNLLGMLGVHDMREAVNECRKRNEARGREYEPTEHAENCWSDVYVRMPVDSEGKPVKPGDFIESFNTHEKSKVKEMVLTNDLRWRVITERWTFYADTSKFRRVEPERTWDDLESELAKAILDDGEARYFVARAKEIAGVE